jgi:hypothetical protein
MWPSLGKYNQEQNYNYKITKYTYNNNINNNFTYVFWLLLYDGDVTNASYMDIIHWNLIWFKTTFYFHILKLFL